MSLDEPYITSLSIINILEQKHSIESQKYFNDSLLKTAQFINLHEYIRVKRTPETVQVFFNLL